MSQTVTVTLPKNYTAEDLIKVDVDDRGYVRATYKVNKHEQKKETCTTLGMMKDGYPVYPNKADPLYNVCIAAEESVKRAMEKK